ncbi:hypothetical protein BJ085DRAFT_39865 [Dimargaris cristalligena]|uniref:Uncharacterized protein n=1 Tax=Dimargaris cristalligena TaxID=215637 RepID=A0A4P9ZS21_9FUNG|nr:hypothetical protein BJ085DRAFT_39865 [Dimargaris cristalligena]|eukprot:RKP35260.1 hypothetical protein BJ085DRAFT_39865 [Dimargaris cristalligena]
MPHTPVLSNTTPTQSAGLKLLKYVFHPDQAKIGKKILGYCNYQEKFNVGILCRSLHKLVAPKKGGPYSHPPSVSLAEIDKRAVLYQTFIRQYPDTLRTLRFNITDEQAFKFEWEEMCKRHTHILNHVNHWKNLAFSMKSLAPCWPLIMRKLAKILPCRLNSRTLYINTTTHCPDGDGQGSRIENLDWLGHLYHHSPQVPEFLGHVTRLIFICRTSIDSTWIYRFFAPFKNLKCL